MNDPTGLPPIIGESPTWMGVVALARRVAPGDASVLLVGPTGSGKDLLAQHIHHWSGRPGNLVAVNCAALPEALVESELFGHGPEAFTSARRGKPGLMETAAGRTLLLDEITSLPWSAQGKLLRALESGEVRRVGETTVRHVSVRFIAAAQDDLGEQLGTRAFRHDLYHRLAQAVISVPALADRATDIAILARHFAAMQGRVLEPDAITVLMGHTWPGNVRELHHTIARAGFVVEDGILPGWAIAQAIRAGLVPASPLSVSARPAIAAVDPALLQACAAHGWHGARTAAALGISRSALYDRLRALGVSLRAAKKAAFVSDRLDNGRQRHTMPDDRGQRDHVTR